MTTINIGCICFFIAPCGLHVGMHASIHPLYTTTHSSVNAPIHSIHYPPSHASIHPLTYSSVPLPIHPSIHSPDSPAIHQFTRSPIYPGSHPSTHSHHSFYHHPFFYSSGHLSIHASSHSPIHPIYSSIHLLSTHSPICMHVLQIL